MFNHEQFPRLTPEEYRQTSSATKLYNCVGWAADDTRHVWWPMRRCFWPPEARRVVTIEAFIEAFQSRGYELCASAELEPGYEKIAIFATFDSMPKHVARQLASGGWTSKMGTGIDIEHSDLAAVDGPEYGRPVQFMRRRRMDPPQAV